MLLNAVKNGFLNTKKINNLKQKARQLDLEAIAHQLIHPEEGKG